MQPTPLYGSGIVGIVPKTCANFKLDPPLLVVLFSSGQNDHLIFYPHHVISSAVFSEGSFWPFGASIPLLVVLSSSGHFGRSFFLSRGYPKLVCYIMLCFCRVVKMTTLHILI
jgi:hypothetical protein